MSAQPFSSRIPGLYRLSPEQRLELARTAAELGASDVEVRALTEGVDLELVDGFIENAVGAFALPLGVAANFVVDGRELLVPMAVEESSVVAAASNMARLVRETGGFITEVLEDRVIGQVQIREVPDGPAALQAVEDHRAEVLALANAQDPMLVRLGGGCTGLVCRILPPEQTGEGTVLVVHLLLDPLDAMGANAVNSMCEAIAPSIAQWTGGEVGLRILSNLADRRRFAASCRVRAADLEAGGWDGREVARRIANAARFAVYDPYRAATHNKGIMNGVDAVVLATGNDWRAVEAGVHAFAARSGRYSALSTWVQDASGDLEGSIELPIQVGTVGGVTRLHPAARFSLRLLGVQGAQDLARILVAVGLCQNLAALRALATEGIQRGHMRLHARNLSLARQDEDEEP